MFLESFELVAERSRCVNGDDQYRDTTSVQGCADLCRNYAVSMFVIDHTKLCGAKCDCYCVMNANPNGTCTMGQHNSFDLYKIVTGKWNSSMCNKDQQNLQQDLNR